MYTQPSINNLREFYSKVDKLSDKLSTTYTGRLQCRKGCSSCCQDEIEVFGLEAELIRQNYSTLLKSGKAGAEGACAFLDEEGSCRVYDSRPFICRVFGLPLEWKENRRGRKDSQRAVCAMNLSGEDMEKLDSRDCIPMHELEEQLALLQYTANEGKMDRIALRILFEPE